MARTRKRLRDAERRPRLLELWLQRAPEKRKSIDVLAFYGWLETNRPELLKRGHGDPYQQLYVDLSGHIDYK